MSAARIDQRGGGDQHHKAQGQKPARPLRDQDENDSEIGAETEAGRCEIARFGSFDDRAGKWVFASRA